MPRGQYLTPHQKGIVKRYYEHKDALMVQKLGEIVSELYLAESPKQAERLWLQAERALLNAKAPRPQVEQLMKTRDLKALATLVNQLF